MKRKIYLIVVVSLIGIFFQFSCKKESCEPNFNSSVDYGTFTDSRDGTEYRTIKIGDQVWIAENLRYICKSEKSIDCNVYGQLYDKYDTSTACPLGWHLPGEGEWMELVNSFGGQEPAGGSLKETGTEHWQSPNTGATNLSGFTALPAGGYDYNSGGFQRDKSAYFWSSTEIEHNGVILIKLQFDSENVEFIEEYPEDKAYPIRCIKDK